MYMYSLVGFWDFQLSDLNSSEDDPMAASKDVWRNAGEYSMD